MNNNPKLRFKEFNNNWNNFALKEFCIINPNNNKTLPNTFFYIDLESVINGQIACKLNAINKDNAPSRAARILQVNDLLYQTVRPYQRNNYLFSNELELPTVASTGYAQIRTTKNSIKFLYQLIHTDRFVNNVMKRCTGTSYPAINSTDLSNIIISVPNIEEQEKIAGFLSKVDELINECEGEVKDLEEQKKGLMQKIFSQQIRFKDSNNNPYPDWEEKVMNDILNEYCKKNSISNQYPVLTSSKQGLMLQTEYYSGENRITEKDNIGFNIIPPNYITYRSRSDDGLFTFNINNLGVTGIVSTYYPVFSTNYNNLFVITYLNINKNNLFKYAVGSSQKVLSLNELKKVKIKLPCQEEQEKITKVLSKMDELIEEKKELLSDWQQFKKGLLQQMFV